MESNLGNNDISLNQCFAAVYLGKAHLIALYI